MRRLILMLAPVLALMLFWAAPGHAEPTFPALSGRVVDAAEIIPPDVEAALDAKLAALETQSQRQLVVATIPSLDGYEISDYGYQLGRAWQIGDKERNDGALLIVAPNERKVRIEVGYGLEPVLTDALSAIIIQQQIVPRFKEGDMPGGIVAGADAIIHQLQLPPEEAQAIAQQAQEAPQGGGGEIFPVVIFLFIVIFFFVIPIIRAVTRGSRGGRRSGFGNAVGNIILWEAINAAMRAGSRGGGGGGWSSGGGGGWGGGGGGFSGGGGSFGGGGASGSW